MSARMKKGASATPKASTPAPRAASPSRNRPPSPNWISRVQEKDHLANLNDRLAAYIDKVRSLESENSRLTKIVTTQEEATKTEVTNIKTLYDVELKEARRLLDETSKAKTRADIENKGLREDNHNLKIRVTEIEKILQEKERFLLTAESQVNELQARLTDAVNQRKHWENEYNRIRKEKETLERRLKECLEKMEDETLKRVDAENRITSLREESNFNKQIHEQEVNEMVKRTRVEIEEVDGRLQEEYTERLSESLRDMRDANDETIRMNREESEETYERQLANLRNELESNADAASRSRSELSEMRKQVEELNSTVSSLNSQLATYETRIRMLEAQLSRQYDEHQRTTAELEAEKQRLRNALDDQISEYRDLLEVKIKLDNEISSYRALLEGEEHRLNISQSSDISSPRRAGTPTRQILTGSSRKRRMAQQSDASASKRQMHSSSNVGFAQNSSAKGPVEITETDTDGKYIKLTNTSDKDQALGGWQLKHIAGGDEDQETSFKFHRTLHVKPGATVTVWSAETDATHSPPTDIVMKGQKWFTGEAMRSSLVSPQGEEMASRDLKRSMLRTTVEFDETDGGEGDSRGHSSRSGGAWGWSFFSFLK